MGGFKQNETSKYQILQEGSGWIGTRFLPTSPPPISWICKDPLKWGKGEAAGEEERGQDFQSPWTGPSGATTAPSPENPSSTVCEWPACDSLTNLCALAHGLVHLQEEKGSLSEESWTDLICLEMNFFSCRWVLEIKSVRHRKKKITFCRP